MSGSNNNNSNDEEFPYLETKIEIPASFVEKYKYGYKFETHFFNNLLTILRNKLKVGENTNGLVPGDEDYVNTFQPYKDKNKIFIQPMGRFNFGNGYDYELKVDVDEKNGKSYIEIVPYVSRIPIPKKEVFEMYNKVEQIKDIIKNTLILMKGGKRRRRHTRKQKRRIVKKTRSKGHRN